MLQTFLRTHRVTSVSSSLLALGIAALVMRSSLPVGASRQEGARSAVAATSKLVIVARAEGTAAPAANPSILQESNASLRSTLQRLTQRLRSSAAVEQNAAPSAISRALPSSSLLSSLLGGGRDGQFLSIQNGQLVWTNPPTAPGTSYGFESGGGRRPPVSHSGGGSGSAGGGGGGGGGSANAQASVQTTAAHDHSNDKQGTNLEINAATYGILGTDQGGTGFGTFATGTLLVGNAGGGLSSYTIGSAGDILSVTGGVVRWRPFTSAVQGPSDARYVNTSGDTMTGALSVRATLSGSRLVISGNANITGALLAVGNISTRGTLSGASLKVMQNASISGSLVMKGAGLFQAGLTIIGTSSGNIIHAEKQLSSSGTILAVGNISTRGTLSGASLKVMQNASVSGSLLIESALSGATIAGFGLIDCDTAASSKLLWDVTTGRFSCGSAAFGSGNVLTLAVGIKGGSMTGSLQTPSINLSGVLLSSLNGFNEALDHGNAGIATNAVTRLTAQGNLTNIGTYQGGEMRITAGYTTASGVLAKTDYTTGSSPRSVAIGDLNGDGKADLAVANYNSSTVSVLLGTGSNTFVAKVDYTTGTNPVSVAINDLNGDGKADLAVANFTSGTVSVFRNTGNGIFVAKVDYTTGANPNSIAIGDLNGDGKADLAVANYSSDTASVLLNKGNGVFDAKVDYTTGSNPVFVAINDLNGDGKADLAVANNSSDTVSVFLNKGGGTFAIKVDYTTGSAPYSVAINDLNGDGKADLAVANYSSNTVSVFRNTGSGAFAANVDYTTGSGPRSVAIVDLNGDGKADLAVANYTSSTVSVLRNTGNGAFAAKVDYKTGTTPQSVAIGDLNGDGKADLAVANSNSATVSVLLNSTRPVLAVLMGTGGAVGIGTPNPGAKLAVSGAVIIDANGNLSNQTPDAGLALEVIGTMSGKILKATTTLASSGTLVFEGAGSGASLYLGTSLQGAGLSDCDNAASSKLLWDVTTGRFSCGSAAFGSGNVLTLGDARYVNTSGDTMTGALSVRGNLSGSRLIVSGNASVTGALLAVGNISTRGTLSGKTLTVMNGNSYLLGSVGIGKSGTPNTTLEVVGTMSGRALQITGTGSYPLLATNLPYGTIMMGTGAMKNGTGAMTPQLYIAGRVPARFTGSGSTGASSFPQSVFVQGRYAYTANNNNSTLSILDVSNPRFPVSVGSVSTGASSGPISVFVHGRYAYTANINDGTLGIVDVSSPSAPIKVGSVSTGTNPNGVFVQGRYAYVVDSWDNTLGIVDVSNPSAPVKVGSVSTGASTNPNGVFVQGRYAYTANNGGDSMGIFDVSNPSAPVKVGSVSTGASSGPISVFVQGRYAYVANYSSSTMSILDVSTPSAPVSVGSVSTGTNPNGVFVQGRYAYTANRGNNTLGILDVSNPRAPISVGSVSTGTVSTPYSVFVQGRYAYTANNTSNTIGIFDLGGAYIQQLEAGSIEASSVNINGELSALNGDFRGGVSIAQGLQAQGPSSFLNTSTGAYALTITSKTGALRLAAQGTVNNPHILFGTGTTFDTKLWRSGVSILYTNASLQIAGTLSGNILHAEKNITSSGTILATGNISTRGTLSGKTLTVMNGNSYLLGNMSIGTTTVKTKLYVNGSGSFIGTMSGKSLFISGSGASPILMTQQSTARVGIGTKAPIEQFHVAGTIPVAFIGSGSMAGQPISLYVQGRTAFMVESGTNLLRTFDVSLSTSPTRLGSVALGTAPKKVVVQGRYAYVTNSGSNTLQVIDVSNPNAPVSISTVTTASNGGPTGLAVQGRYAYVTNASASTMSVVDVGNPTSPVVVGSVATTANPTNIVVQGVYAYVGGFTSNTFQVFDVTNPAAPVRKGSTTLNTIGTTKVLAVQGRYAYLFGGVSGSSQIDVSNPASPSDSLLGVGFSPVPVSLAVQGQYLYVGKTSAITVLAVGDGATSASIVGTYTDNLSHDDLFVSGRFVYSITRTSKAMNIFDFGGAYIQQLEAGGIEAASLSLRNNLYAINADFRGSLTVGQGLQANSPSSFLNTATGAYALTITSKSGGLKLAAQGNINQAHIVFGTGTTFDTKLWRSAVSTLYTNGSLYAASTLSGSLVQANTLASSGTIAIRNSTTTATTNLFTVTSNVSSTNNLVFRISASGAVYADGVYNSAGADYAEWFYEGGQKGQERQEGLKAGEVVCIDTENKNAVKRCTRDGDNDVIGIVSTKPSFVGNVMSGAEGLPVPGTVLVGLIGQVPAKAIVTPLRSSGSFAGQGGDVIRPGDSVTAAATPGFVRRAKAGESTVGVALEGLGDGTSNEQRATINILISRKNSSVTVDAVGQKVLDTIADMKIGDEVQKTVNAAMDRFDLNDSVQSAVNAQMTSLDLAGQISKILDGKLGSSSFVSTKDLADLRSQILGLSDSFHSDGILAALASQAGIVVTQSGAHVGLQNLSISGSLRVVGNATVTGLRADHLEASRGSLTSLTVTSGANILSLHAAAGSVDTLTVNRSLTFASGATLSGALTASHFSINALTISGSTVQIGSLMSTGALRVMGPITIDGLATFFGNVDVRGELSVSGKQAGIAVAAKGSTGVVVTFSGAFRNTPIVTASSDDFAAWRLRNRTQSGFSIELKELADHDITFTWLALSSASPSITSSTGGAPETLIDFPVDALGYPMSSDAIWNACIRGHVTLDADGTPYSCARYHEESTWTQPDLKIEFVWNANHDPKILVLPTGYVQVVQGDAIKSEPVPEQTPATVTPTPEAATVTVSGTGSAFIGPILTIAPVAATTETGTTATTKTQTTEQAAVSGTGAAATATGTPLRSSGATEGQGGTINEESTAY